MLYDNKCGFILYYSGNVFGVTIIEAVLLLSLCISIWCFVQYGASHNHCMRNQCARSYVNDALAIVCAMILAGFRYTTVVYG